MSEASDLRRNPVADRDEHDRRVILAKQLAEKAAVCATLAIVPPEMRAMLGLFATLIVDLARDSHAKFEMYPFDLAALTRRVDALDGLTGDGAVPALARRVTALERGNNGNGNRAG